MREKQLTTNEFLSSVNQILQQNLSDELFGVKELATRLHLSRSQLLRKVKAHTGLSVSQYIRNLRLEKAMDLLKSTSKTVSEISYDVGFKSTSYFIKCFREYYGYPPGEVRKIKHSSGSQMESQNHPHKLVAIMFTDIEGYTALMQKDEDKALKLIHRHREVFNNTTKKYQGRILQFYGDGTLSTFSSAIEAVHCGIEMQLAFREDPVIPVRIGIHSGDILFNKNGIIGDGVNIASRIESLAIPASVLISDKVYDEVKNQKAIQTILLGPFHFKNVKKPIEVYAVSNPGLAIPEKDKITGKLQPEKRNHKTRIAGGSFLSKYLLWMLPVVVMGLLLLFGKNWIQIEKRSGQLIVPQVAAKSIAVLPFINDSNDSNNVYIINGLMESILNNLQKIEDIRVISRTSVEKYRRSKSNIQDISAELGVKYLVEGSGQKIGDEILLHIQLVDGDIDQHVWSEQYQRGVNDIFSLQKEVSKEIAGQIAAIISPEEARQIEKIPTKNMAAYDFFLQGQEAMFDHSKEGLIQAIPLLKKATQLDPEFAHAYADLGIAYYYLDLLGPKNFYQDTINYYADKAILYDPELSQALVAKALFYLKNQEPHLSINYLQAALDFNPNSAMVTNLLAEIYTNHLPNTEKYLEYALKGLQLNTFSRDSVTTSFTYLHVSNALAQAGFSEEALRFIDKSLNYDPENLFAEYVKAYIKFSLTRDLRQLNISLLSTLEKDTSRIDVLQEVAKSYYFLRDYKHAFQYYQKYNRIKSVQNLDIYPAENGKIAVVYAEMGQQKLSDQFLEAFKTYAENDRSIYRDLSLSAYYGYKDEKVLAINHLRQFSKQKNIHYWSIIFIKISPLLENILQDVEVKRILTDMEDKFWDHHLIIRKNLEKEGLLVH